MKIKHLIKKLQKLDENLDVLLAGEEKGHYYGNYFSKLNGLSLHFYNCDWGEVIEDENDIDKENKKTKKVLILWPE